MIDAGCMTADTCVVHLFSVCLYTVQFCLVFSFCCLLLAKSLKIVVVSCAPHAAPIALKSHGIFSGKKVTSHPSVDKQLKEAGKSVSSHVFNGHILSTFSNCYI